MLNDHTGGLYAYLANDEGGWIWQLTGTVWEPLAAREDIRYRGWRTKLCTRVGRAETRLHINVLWMTISWDAYEKDMRSYIIDHHQRLWYRSSFQSSNNDHRWAGPAEFTRNWECSSDSGLRKYSEYDRLLGCLQVWYTNVMVMAMTMMSSERKAPPMPPSQDKAHTMIGDFTEITVSNSDNNLHLAWVMSARLDGQMPDIPEVETWRTVSLWMFLLSLLFSLLVSFFTSLDLGPVQMASAQVFTTSGDKSGGCRVSPCARSAEWLPYGTDRFWDLWLLTFVYVERLFGCFVSTLVRVYAAQGVGT